MTLSATIRVSVEAALDANIESLDAYKVSDFNQAYRIRLSDGREALLKVNEQCAPDFFSAEAFGLNELQQVGGLKVPQCFAQSRNFIAIEWLESATPDQNFDSLLARGLVAQHSSESDYFGFPINNYCGASAQANQPLDDGYVFFAERRLIPQGKRALDAGLLGSQHIRSLEHICLRLPDLIPNQTPALLHGDLWRGNVIAGSTGEPALIDPACYYGWPEADLAMMQLFGGFSTRLLSAYNELKPIPSGFEERCDIYNLYHLLNHLNLFGAAYLSNVRQTLERFSKRSV